MSNSRMKRVIDKGLARSTATLLIGLAFAMLSGCATLSPTVARPTPRASTPVAGTATVSGSGATPGPGTAVGMLHVHGAQLVDDAGHPVLLHGAMIPTAFAYIKAWQAGSDPTQSLSSTTFQVMQRWRMNALRVNISYWIYRLDPTAYLARLDQAVQQANQAGLYVILDFHDDRQSGSPYSDRMMHPETLTFWTIIASHFKATSMVLFDPMNEPKYPNWTTWLNGDGSTIVGFQQVIDAIRATGAHQVIVVEPGGASGQGGAMQAGWATIGNNLPTDANVMYSRHDYQQVAMGNPTQWDAEWGPILYHYPIFYGEWAALPHANYPIFCSGMTSANADQLVNAFLSYLQSRQANWTAWSFTPNEMVQNYTNYTPTSMQAGAPWSCQSTSASQAGMGQDIQRFLASHP